MISIVDFEFLNKLLLISGTLLRFVVVFIEIYNQTFFNFIKVIQIT